MQKTHIVTIAGKPGSGKSSASKGVASELGYKHFSSGDLMRAIGKDHGIDDIHKVNLVAEKNLNFDELVDSRLKEIGGSDTEIVIDSRMAWHWIPNSFKVYLDLDLETAAERILGDMDEVRRSHEFIPSSVEEYSKILESRLESEAKRYKKLYNVNPFELSHYDLVVDTKHNDKDAVLQAIVENYHKFLATT